jgi:DNA-binding beta-propeller fold protein YncE
VLFPYADVVYMIDTLTSTISGTLRMPGPAGMTFNRTGTRAYISSSLEGVTTGSSMKVVNTATFQIIDTINLPGGAPGHVAMTADGRSLLVKDNLSTKFWTIDLTTKTVAGIRSSSLVVLP